MDIRIPRDRNGEYEPRIVSKYDRNADGMAEKIIVLYACELSQRDIAKQIKALYDVEISPELVSKISEKIMPEVSAWQNRPLNAVYPFVFLDGQFPTSDLVVISVPSAADNNCRFLYSIAEHIEDFLAAWRCAVYGYRHISENRFPWDFREVTTNNAN